MTFQDWYHSTGPWPGNSRDMEDAWNAALEHADTSVQQGVVYQIFAHRHSMTACWEDVPKEMYNRTHEAQRRIVYMRSPSEDENFWDAQKWRAHIEAKSDKQEAVSDAEIQACALVIKGIFATDPRENWTFEIEKRIRYMLKQKTNTASLPDVEPGQCAHCGHIEAESDKRLRGTSIREVR